MPLTDEQIEILLKQAADTSRRGGKRAPKPVERNYEGWFGLHLKLMNEEADYAPMRCENPNCPDQRNDSRGQMCAKPPGTDKYMCRICFLNGWLSIEQPQEQEKMEV